MPTGCSDRGARNAAKLPSRSESPTHPARTPVAILLTAWLVLHFGGPGISNLSAQQRPGRPVAKADEWAVAGEFQQKLLGEASVSWSDIALRDALTSLSQAHRTAVFLDPRIDPDRELQMNAQGSLRGIFDEIADVYTEKYARPDVRPRPARALGVTQVGAVIYFGPAETVGAARTAAQIRGQELRQLPAAQRQRLLQSHRTQWETPTAPRQLIEALAAEYRVTIEPLDMVPHDLWAAGDWPPLLMSDRLTLLLAPFDLTWSLADGGQRFVLRPLAPADSTLEKDYPAGAQPEDFAEQIRKLLPRAEVRLIGRQVRVRGTADDHDRLEQARKRGSEIAAQQGAGEKPGATPSATTTPAAPAGEVRYTLRFANATVRQALAALGEKLELTIEYDSDAIEAAGKSLDARVTVAVKDVTLDGLLRAVLDQAELRYVREGTVVRVEPK